MTDDKIPPSNSAFFGIRIHHIIPIKLFETYEEILSLAGIEQEARGNKITLFFDSDYLQSIVNSSDLLKAAFIAAGFGFNTHRGNHPGYSEFIRGELRGIDQRNSTDGVIGESAKAAVIRETKTLFAFVKAVSGGDSRFGGLAIDGSVDQVKSQMTAQFAVVKAALLGAPQAPDVTPEQIAAAEAFIAEAQTAAFDAALVDAETLEKLGGAEECGRTWKLVRVD